MFANINILSVSLFYNTCSGGTWLQSELFYNFITQGTWWADSGAEALSTSRTRAKLVGGGSNIKCPDAGGLSGNISGRKESKYYFIHSQIYVKCPDAGSLSGNNCGRKESRYYFIHSQHSINLPWRSKRCDSAGLWKLTHCGTLVNFDEKLTIQYHVIFHVS